MSDFLRVFEAKALASALTEAGHAVSERTVQRWKAGVTKPKPQDLRAIRDLLETHEEAAAPVWAAAMEDRLRLDLERNRTLIESLVPVDIRLAAERVIERLEALSPPGDEGPNAPDGGEAPASEGPQVQGHESPPDQAVGQ